MHALAQQNISQVTESSSAQVRQVEEKNVAGMLLLVKGKVFIINSAGEKLPAKIRDKIYTGDRIETGNDGIVQVSFADGSIMKLAGNSDFTVKDYKFEDKGEAKSDISIENGTFAFLAGKIAKVAPQNYKIQTSTATIGIRGSGGEGVTSDGTKGTPAGLQVATQAGHVLDIKTAIGNFVIDKPDVGLKVSVTGQAQPLPITGSIFEKAVQEQVQSNQGGIQNDPSSKDGDKGEPPIKNESANDSKNLSSPLPPGKVDTSLVNSFTNSTANITQQVQLQAQQQVLTANSVKDASSSASNTNSIYSLRIQSELSNLSKVSENLKNYINGAVTDLSKELASLRTRIEGSNDVSNSQNILAEAKIAQINTQAVLSELESKYQTAVNVKTAIDKLQAEAIATNSLNAVAFVDNSDVYNQFSILTDQKNIYSQIIAKERVQAVVDAADYRYAKIWISESTNNFNAKEALFHDPSSIIYKEGIQHCINEYTNFNSTYRDSTGAITNINNLSDAESLIAKVGIVFNTIDGVLPSLEKEFNALTVIKTDPNIGYDAAVKYANKYPDLVQAVSTVENDYNNIRNLYTDLQLAAKELNPLDADSTMHNFYEQAYAKYKEYTTPSVVTVASNYDKITLLGAPNGDRQVVETSGDVVQSSLDKTYEFRKIDATGIIPDGIHPNNFLEQFVSIGTEPIITTADPTNNTIQTVNAIGFHEPGAFPEFYVGKITLNPAITPSNVQEEQYIVMGTPITGNDAISNVIDPSKNSIANGLQLFEFNYVQGNSTNSSPPSGVIIDTNMNGATIIAGPEKSFETGKNIIGVDYNKNLVVGSFEFKKGKDIHPSLGNHESVKPDFFVVGKVDSNIGSEGQFVDVYSFNKLGSSYVENLNQELDLSIVPNNQELKGQLYGTFGQGISFKSIGDDPKITLSSFAKDMTVASVEEYLPIQAEADQYMVVGQALRIKDGASYETLPVFNLSLANIETDQHILSYGYTAANLAGYIGHPAALINKELGITSLSGIIDSNGSISPLNYITADPDNSFLALEPFSAEQKRVDGYQNFSQAAKMTLQVIEKDALGVEQARIPAKYNNLLAVVPAVYESPDLGLNAQYINGVNIGETLTGYTPAMFQGAIKGNTVVPGVLDLNNNPQVQIHKNQGILLASVSEDQALSGLGYLGDYVLVFNKAVGGIVSNTECATLDLHNYEISLVPTPNKWAYVGTTIADPLADSTSKNISGYLVDSGVPLSNPPSRNIVGGIALEYSNRSSYWDSSLTRDVVQLQNMVGFAPHRPYDGVKDARNDFSGIFYGTHLSSRNSSPISVINKNGGDTFTAAVAALNFNSGSNDLGSKGIFINKDGFVIDKDSSWTISSACQTFLPGYTASYVNNLCNIAKMDSYFYASMPALNYKYVGWAENFFKYNGADSSLLDQSVWGITTFINPTNLADATKWLDFYNHFTVNGTADAKLKFTGDACAIMTQLSSGAQSKIWGTTHLTLDVNTAKIEGTANFQNHGTVNFVNTDIDTSSAGWKFAGTTSLTDTSGITSGSGQFSGRFASDNSTNDITKQALEACGGFQAHNSTVHMAGGFLTKREP
jgi:hypothetical protein